MSPKALTAALALTALSLAACDHGGRMVNAKICTSFNTAGTTQSPAVMTTGADAAAPVDDCVRRWAYSLAGARDQADVVADAAVAACATTLGRWNQAGLGQAGGPPVEALSLTTGQPTNQMAEHSAFAHGRALLYTVQARAGRCAPPPATNGVPAGT